MSNPRGLVGQEQVVDLVQRIARLEALVRGGPSRLPPAETPATVTRRVKVVGHGWAEGQMVEPATGAKATPVSGAQVRALVLRVLGDDDALLLYHGQGRLATPPAEEYATYFLSHDTAGAVVLADDFEGGPGVARIPAFVHLTDGRVIMASDVGAVDHDHLLSEDLRDIDMATGPGAGVVSFFGSNLLGINDADSESLEDVIPFGFFGIDYGAAGVETVGEASPSSVGFSLQHSFNPSYDSGVDPFGYEWHLVGGSTQFTRPARGTAAKPVTIYFGDYISGGSVTGSMDISAITCALPNAMRDLQDVEEVAIEDMEDGWVPYWTGTKFLLGPVGDTSLSETGVTPGGYGAGSLAVSITVDAQGRVTAASNYSPIITGDVTGDLNGGVTVEALQGRAWPSSAPTDYHIPVASAGAWSFSGILAAGTAGQVLAGTGTTPPAAWKTLATTRGDLITRDASDFARIAIGAAGFLLGSDGTDPAWVDALFLKLGNYATKTVYTSGTGTHTFNANCKYWIAFVMAGGGGGGAGTGTLGSGNTTPGGGGGNGGLILVLGRKTTSSVAYSVGAGGAAASSPAGSGTDGSDSSLGSMTAKGGKAGTGTTSTAGASTGSHGGKAGSFGGDPDTLLQDSAADRIAIPIGTNDGQPGRVVRHATNADCAGGRGGGNPLNNSYGKGGDGGDDAGGATAGAGGYIAVYELT